MTDDTWALAKIMTTEQSTSGLASLGNTSLLLDNASTLLSNDTPGYYDYNDNIYDDDNIDKPSTAGSVALGLGRYLFPAIILVGTTGNLLSAAVIVRRRMRTISIYCYLMVLALVDTIVLFVSALKTWIRLVSGVEWLHASTAACKTIMFLLLVALHLSAWLIVVVSADRFVAVWMPLKALTMCTARRARFVCAVVTVIIVLANLHVFSTIHLIHD